MKALRMNLGGRLLRVALVGSAVGWLGWSLPRGGRWLVPTALTFSAWALARNLYLSGFRVEVDDAQLTLSSRGRRTKTVRWQDLVSAQSLYPSLGALFALVNEPALPFGARRNVPLGFDWRNQVRRLLTMSPDLLVIGGHGEFAMIPLGALPDEGRMELLAKVSSHVPSSWSRKSALDDAVRCEGEAEQRMLQRDWAAAVPLYERAVEGWMGAGRPDQCNRSLQNIATCLTHLGRYTEAAGALERALVLCRNLNDEPGEANTRNALAGVERAVGDKSGLLAAIRHLAKARKIHYRRGDTFLEARMLSNQALCRERLFLLLREEAPARAARVLARCQQLAEKGLDVLERVPHGVPSADLKAQTANLKGTLAHCAFMREEWPTAAKSFSDAADLSPDRVILVDRAMWGRAEFMRASSPSIDTVESKRLTHEAMELVDEAIRSLPFSGDHEEMMEILTLRGDIYWDMQRWDEAARDYEYVLSLIEQRPFAFSRPTDRVALRRRFRTLFPRVVEANLQLAIDDPPHAGDHVASAFGASERFKATSLRDMLASSEALALLSGSARLDLERAQSDQKAALVHAESLRESADLALRAEAWTRLAEAEERLKRASSKALEEVPALAELMERRVVSFDDTLAKLPDEHTGILQFSLCEGGLAAFLLCRAVAPEQAFWLIPSVTRTHWPAAVARFQQRYDKFADAAERNEPFVENRRDAWVNTLPKLVTAVQQEIFSARADTAPENSETIAKALETLNLARLVLVPEGILSRLPLHVGVPEGVHVTFSPSSTILFESAKRSRGQPRDLLRDLLIVDDPGGSIPAAVREADIIERQAQAAGVKPRRLPGSKARPDAVLAGMRETSWLHYGGHAFSSHRDPWSSWLEAAGGKLTARALLQQDAVRRGSAAIVNGCSSGVVQDQDAGEFAGLPAAFLALGYSVVISTLWDVPLGSPVFVMDHFYDNLWSRRQPVDEALTSAVATLRDQSVEDLAAYARRHGLSDDDVDGEVKLPPPSHPLHWAGYVIWGAAWSGDEAVATEALGKSARKTRIPLVLSTAQGAPQEMLDLVNHAKRLHGEKQYEQVRLIYEQCIERWGPNRLLLSGLGEIYTLLGQCERALPYDEKALEMDLNSPRSYYSLGCSYMDLGQITRARDCFRKALYLDPGYWKAMCNLGVLSNSPSELLGHLRAAARIKVDDADTQRAIAHWEDIARTPDFDLAAHRLHWAMGCVERGEWNHTRRELALARELDLDAEQKVVAFGTEAEVFRKQGKLRESIACLEASLRLDDSTPSVWNTLSARCYLLAMDPTTEAVESRSLLNRAVDAGRNAIRCGDYSRPRRNLALAHVGLGELIDARREASRAGEMARSQIANGPEGALVCPGCPTGGKRPQECQECLTLADSVMGDIHLVDGHYRV